MSKTPEQLVFGLDIGTRSIVGTVGHRNSAGAFTVIAQCIRYHKTRAMLDGQIHDIAKVAETIGEVRRELEKKLDRKLTEVCIAAAGRVLKTVEIHTEFNLEDDAVIAPEHIRSMELVGVDEAHKKLREQLTGVNEVYYCVGYSVVHYYIGGVPIGNLEGHKARSIEADILATFLPEDVIDGLYAATERAGLKVVNLTLEPIAAINVAIPEKFRLLNLALVDVGAGTSDICITKEGSVTAYGMLPCAGDFLTEAIMHGCLVEFDEAEKIKIALSGKKKKINYTDILGLKQTANADDIKRMIEPNMKKMTADIADRICELNGGKTVSAIFIVGGGGKNPDFAKFLSEKTGIPAERVAIRGEEVLGEINFADDSIRPDSTLVTPIGICLNYYEQNNNFIYVEVNDEKVKLYDNGKLTVMDAALAIDFPNEKLFPRRGKELNFTVNGSRRMVRGEAGESAVITINGRSASISSAVVQNDNIQITGSTAGETAHALVRELPEHSSKIEFLVNGKKLSCPAIITVKGEIVSEFYEIQNEDEIVIQNFYTVGQLLEFMDVKRQGVVLVNNIPATDDSTVYENFNVDFGIDAERMLEEIQGEAKAEAKPEVKYPEVELMVNNRPVLLKGKNSYCLVDIIDAIGFDTSVSHGEEVVMTINGERAEFATPVDNGNIVELYWK